MSCPKVPGTKGAQGWAGHLFTRAEHNGQFAIAPAEKGTADLGVLSLDQKQALAAHPDRQIARQARELLAKGGGLPNADRQKVVEELMPLTQKKGDAAAGKVVFTKQCAKCHTHSGEGAKIGPDLTGMAVHPKAELLVQMIDPSRSVEMRAPMPDCTLPVAPTISSEFLRWRCTCRHRACRNASLPTVACAPVSMMVRTLMLPTMASTISRLAASRRTGSVTKPGRARLLRDREMST